MLPPDLGSTGPLHTACGTTALGRIRIADALRVCVLAPAATPALSARRLVALACGAQDHFGQLISDRRRQIVLAPAAEVIQGTIVGPLVHQRRAASAHRCSTAKAPMLPLTGALRLPLWLGAVKAPAGGRGPALARATAVRGYVHTTANSLLPALECRSRRIKSFYGVLVPGTL